LDLVGWAEDEARPRLEPLGARWRHAQAVGARAREVAVVCDPPDREVLVAAALLHERRVPPDRADTGFHPVDGARWLASKGHARLAALVAHHSRSSFEAQELGLQAALDEFSDESSVVTDTLTYCGLTTGPGGEGVTAVERIREIEQRYGAESVVVRAMQAASADLLAAVERTERRLERSSVH
jgi:hypothetical protein